MMKPTTFVYRIALLLPLMATSWPASAQPQDSSSEQLTRVFGLIRDSYPGRVDPAGLAAIGAEAMRETSGVAPNAWRSCLLRDDQRRSGPTRGEDALLADALACAGSQATVTSQDLVDGALRAMLATLEGTNSWLTPADLQRTGSPVPAPAAGGLTLIGTLSGPRVVRLGRRAPAALAGVVKGDTLVAVDGRQVGALAVDDVVPMIRGPVGSAVTLTLQAADGSQRRLVVERRMIDVLKSELEIERSNQILNIAVYSMPPGIAAAVEVRLRAEQPRPRAMVLDLRGKTGGLLDEAIKLADLFLDDATIVTSRGKTPRDVEVYRSRKGQAAAGIPLAVLVDGGTAAGAEILAAAIQDAGRGVVVGERTGGHGTVQTLLLVDPGHAVRLTTSYQYRANGKRLNDAPIVPDCSMDAGSGDAMLRAAALAVRDSTGCTGNADRARHAVE